VTLPVGSCGVWRTGSVSRPDCFTFSESGSFRGPYRRGVTSHDQLSYVVAEIENDGRLVIGAWTYEVFTELAEALAELADAHDAGLTGHQVYTLKRCPALALVSHAGYQP
jgi:hypothetical protein